MQRPAKAIYQLAPGELSLFLEVCSHHSPESRQPTSPPLTPVISRSLMPISPGGPLLIGSWESGRAVAISAEGLLVSSRQVGVVHIYDVDRVDARLVHYALSGSTISLSVRITGNKTPWLSHKSGGLQMALVEHHKTRLYILPVHSWPVVI